MLAAASVSFLLIVPTLVHAAPDTLSTRSAWTIIADDFSIGVGDAGSIFTAPLHYGTDQWMDVAAVGAGVLVALPFDSTGRRWVMLNKNRVETGDFEGGVNLDGLTSAGNFYGNAAVGAAIGGAAYFGGLALKKDNLRVTGRMVIEALCFSGIVTTVLKSAIGRSRPYVDEGAFKFRGPQFNTQHTSFPSGHATVAFAVSSVLAARMNTPMSTILLYGMATITAGARVYSDAHWISDTFMGAAIGGFIGYGVAHLHDDDNASHAWRLVPTGNGMALVGRF